LVICFNLLVAYGSFRKLVEGGREDMTKRENAQNYYRQHRKEILAQKRKAYALKKEEKKPTWKKTQKQLNTQRKK
jgi:hypothetical protein